MSTIFSKIASGEIPSYKIAESDQFYAFLDINPLSKGHTLVIPRQETDYLFDLDDNLLSDMIIFSKNIAKAIALAVPCLRIGVAVIGLEVPHSHIHLIPMQSEQDMNFANPKLKIAPEEMASIAEAIRGKL